MGHDNRNFAKILVEFAFILIKTSKFNIISKVTNIYDAVVRRKTTPPSNE
jgi:hypothetical protein